LAKSLYQNELSYPDSLNCTLKKGTALHYLGRYQQAIECFDKDIEISEE
jgi:tetratricopeptide (TPR) repeat protein